jgi:hypothetical protein
VAVARVPQGSVALGNESVIETLAALRLLTAEALATVVEPVIVKGVLKVLSVAGQTANKMGKVEEVLDRRG